MTRGALAAVALVGFATSCRSLSGPEIREDRRTGVIDYYGSPVTVSVPEAATVGAAFQVSVRTYGGGCTRQGDTQVRVEGALVEVEAFDYESSGQNLACPDILRQFTHTAGIRLFTPGTTTVRIIGIRQPDGSRITVERTVQVSRVP